MLLSQNNRKPSSVRKCVHKFFAGYCWGWEKEPQLTRKPINLPLDNSELPVWRRGSEAVKTIFFFHMFSIFSGACHHPLKIYQNHSQNTYCKYSKTWLIRINAHYVKVLVHLAFLLMSSLWLILRHIVTDWNYEMLAKLCKLMMQASKGEFMFYLSVTPSDHLVIHHLHRLLCVHTK
jgi:hypothetical protein